MKRRRMTGLAVCLGLIFCLQAARGEFGTGFGGGPYSIFAEGLGLVDAAGSCLEALAVMVLALIVDAIRFGIIHPIVEEIRDSRYEKKLRDAESLRADDPAFDPDEVTAWAQNLYMRLQREWEKKDDQPDVLGRCLEAVEDELGENILDKNTRRLDKLSGRGMRPHTSDIRFRNTSVIGWYSKRKKIILDLNMQVERKAWYTNRKGEYLDGKEPVLTLVTHCWRLSRPAGAVTAGEKTRCDCGKKVSALYGECPSCGKKLKRPADAWKLEKIVEDIEPQQKLEAPSPADSAECEWDRPRRLDTYEAQEINTEMLVRTSKSEWGAAKDELILPDLRLPYNMMEKVKYNPDDMTVKIRMKKEWPGEQSFSLIFNDKSRKQAKAACQYMNRKIQ